MEGHKRGVAVQLGEQVYDPASECYEKPRRVEATEWKNDSKSALSTSRVRGRGDVW